MTRAEFMGTWGVHIRKGVAYVPSQAKTEAGWYQNVEPVRVVDVHDRDALAAALDNAMASGNPIIPTPTAYNFPEWVVLEPAGVKERTFWKDAISISVDRFEDHWEVHQGDKSTQWQARGKTKRLPAEATTRDIAGLIITIVDKGDEVFTEEMRQYEEELERKREERARLAAEIFGRPFRKPRKPKKN